LGKNLFYIQCRTIIFGALVNKSARPGASVRIIGEPMKQLEVKCRLKLQNKSTLVSQNKLEVSLPCNNCQRDHRTAIFTNTIDNGMCAPLWNCDGFDGKLIQFAILADTTLYWQVHFNFTPFKDRKYGHNVQPTSTWARVSFKIECGGCRKISDVSTQSNFERPHESQCKYCGTRLWIEDSDPIQISVT